MLNVTPYKQIVFTDIDDTLIQTKLKCPPETPLHDGGANSQGEMISFYSEQQKTLLNWFNTARTIPVTGRNSAALNRLTFTFKHEKVINHGALILGQDNQVDPTWLQQITSDINAWHEFLIYLESKVQTLIKQHGLTMRCRIVEDYNVPCYISIKGNHHQFEHLKELLTEHKAYRSAAKIHINGRNMALLPCYANKANAVHYLMAHYKKQYDHPLFIGSGDSHTDVPFMQLCHFMMIPNSSQINQSNRLNHDF